MVAVGIISALAVSLVSGQNIASTRNYYGLQALNIAEGGMRYLVATTLAADSDFSDNPALGPIALGSGSFSVAYASQTMRNCVVQVTGTANGVSRTIQAEFKKGGLPFGFDYALCALDPSATLYITNSAAVYGDFYYNGAVVMTNSAKLQNGTMYSDSLTLQNSATCASWESIIDPLEPITFDTTYYENLLNETDHGAGSALNLSSGTMNLSGGTYYYTSINVSNTARINGPGTIVATTGNFNLSNTARLGDNITVIVKGTATFSNNSRVGANFHIIADGSISINNGQAIPSEALLYSNGDVVFNNSSTFAGVILAPSGSVTSLNSTTFNGLLYANSINMTNSTRLNGSVVVNQVGTFANSTVVTYDPSKLPSTIPFGFENGGESSAGFTITDWKEVY